MEKTVLIGSGIVNLVSAYFLLKNNHQLTLIDKAPNPLQACAWKDAGCTFGGENVRMFTYTEADNYNEKGSQLYSSMDQAFEQVIGEDGWLTQPKELLNEQEKSWIRDFHAVHPEDAKLYAEEIYAVNMASGILWRKWMQEAPELFEGVDFVDDILRIYSSEADFVAAQALHGRLGSLTKILSTEEVLSSYPFLQHAVQSDMLGGCMLVKGFTLRVKDFSKKIIQYLEQQGAVFRWETEFSEIRRDLNGEVTGVIIDGKEENYDNYVLSLGAFAGSTLRNTQTNNQLHGVLGVWLTLPNVYPSLDHSMKIHKTGKVGEDTNVTLIQENGQSKLVLGSGYGYTGNATQNLVEGYELADLFESVKATAQTYFPEAYAQIAQQEDQFGNYCVRGWTPTGLGVFESIPTHEGGQLIITGGNNTGGFTQAPIVAEAVVDSMQGKTHPLHHTFSPERMKPQPVQSV